MTKKNTFASLLLLLSFVMFSQSFVVKKENASLQIPRSYLDSIKKSFVSYDKSSLVDSLWMNQVINFDLYANVDIEINTLNIDKDIDKELPTALLKERLARMDAKSPFNIEYNQGLENLIKSFLKNRRKAFEHQMAISEYYFPIFEEALAKQNVPLEIKYLAVVESALNPKAVSKMGATGLWQFMYQTGKQYNLSIDSYVDERSDPLKSSDAAAKYMTNMYAIFGDWDLVLASYNSGPGNVTKAIRRSGGLQNFWNIKKNLPLETQGYVPAFLATMYIYEYHTVHGIIPKKAVIKHFATDTIMIKKEMSFTQISNLLDIPVEQLQVLNPSYKRNVIPFYSNKSHYLTLPTKKAAVFAANEDKIYAYTEHELNKREKTIEWRKPSAIIDLAIALVSKNKTKYYKVKRGDNLSDIADKNNVTVSDLKKWNHLKGNSVACGKSLKIVLEDPADKAIVAANKSKSTSEGENQKVVLTESKENKLNKNDVLITDSASFYTVQKGDNLSSIAKKNNVTIAEIKDWNHLTTTNLKLGASLQVTNQIVVNQKIATMASELNPGNTLIAKNGAVIVTVDSFKKKDNTVSSTSREEASYLVKKGDSLFSISKQYPGVTISDLKKWNNISNDDLKPGMGLKIMR